MRIKPIGWLIKNFFKKIFSWIFRRGRYAKKNPEAAATANPSRGDGLIGKNPSDTVPELDSTKPVDHLEKSSPNPATQTADFTRQSELGVSPTPANPSNERNSAHLVETTPDITKQPALEVTPPKSIDSPGNADPNKLPSGFRRYLPSEEYLKWLPGYGKKAHSAGDTAPSI